MNITFWFKVSGGISNVCEITHLRFCSGGPYCRPWSRKWFCRPYFPSWKSGAGKKHCRLSGLVEPHRTVCRRCGGHSARPGLFLRRRAAALVWRRRTPHAETFMPAGFWQHCSVLRGGQTTFEIYSNGLERILMLISLSVDKSPVSNATRKSSKPAKNGSRMMAILRNLACYAWQSMTILPLPPGRWRQNLIRRCDSLVYKTIRVLPVSFWFWLPCWGCQMALPFYPYN